MTPRSWFDAHLDLAYLAVCGRDMLAGLADLTEQTQGPDPPAGVTLPSLREGNVRFALGTIFTEVVEGDSYPGAAQYRAGDAEGAHWRGRAQLEAYLTWADRGLAAIDLPRALRPDPGVGRVRGGMGVAEVEPDAPEDLATRAARDGRLHLCLLMENADPIREPGELAWWVERGVGVVGLTWARSSRYAAGNAVPPEDRAGLTPLGRDLVREMDRLGVVHDVSHLSDRSLEDLLGATDRVVIASHSNCRALVAPEGHAGNWQRHLTDRAVREIARRGGVIGLNLFSKFLMRGGEGDRRATLDEAVAHVERVCELTGSTAHVGLGSDMDGGFGADKLPAGVSRPRDLQRLADAMTRRGWRAEDVENFAWRNWCRVLGRAPAC